jgi:hypothetical protein
MSIEAEQIALIRTQTLTQLEQLRASPKPSYSIDGQNVSWTDYAASLQQTVDWCDRKLADYEPFELKSEATTG